jgi:hypothetical protein
MRYTTGDKVQLGDKVRIERDRTEGVVVAIAESNKDMEGLGVDEPGVLIESEPFGLVFWPNSDVDPIIFVQRNESNE